MSEPTSVDYKALYQREHKADDGKYAGGKIRGLGTIIELVNQTKPRNLLDYGSGKGYQYLVSRVHESWGGLLPYCYDIGVRQLQGKPRGPFDGIISCDMMEHIAEPDIDAVLGDIFGLSARRPEPDLSFIYFNISCVPAKRAFRDGTNVHLTVKPEKWWLARIEKFHRPGLIVKTNFRTE